jgi:hypothetical protein
MQHVARNFYGTANDDEPHDVATAMDEPAAFRTEIFDMPRT